MVTRPCGGAGIHRHRLRGTHIPAIDQLARSDPATANGVSTSIARAAPQPNAAAPAPAGRQVEPVMETSRHSVFLSNRAPSTATSSIGTVSVATAFADGRSLRCVVSVFLPAATAPAA